MKKTYNSTHQPNSYRFTIILGLLITIVISISIILFLRSNNDTNSVNELSIQPSNSIPSFLTSSFPETNWQKVDASIEKAQSGGPGKDGIPAIDSPKFVGLDQVNTRDVVQAIVIDDNGTKKVYPYNILVWHEIVNDFAGNLPVAVTFCPLCGSAVVYDRNLSSGVTTFGVSGGLIESNMIMYDRETESLWQQSTGKGIAGDFQGSELTRVPFQLLTLGEVRSQYPDAKILSEDTGFSRDYVSNPYSGYDESENFYFRPSSVDERYPSKDIFVAFEVNDTPVASPWLLLESGNTYTTEVASETITLAKEKGELKVTNSRGDEVPFYFEMWFSWAIQNPEEGIVFDPSK